MEEPTKLEGVLYRELTKECTHAGDEIGVPPVVCASLGNDAGIIGAAFLERIM